MATVINHHTLQMELDFEADAGRRARQEWQIALDQDLRALQDYVYEHQYIVWQPGERRRGAKAQEVHLTTHEACTCSRFKLRGSCQHIAFVRKLEETGTLPDTKTPVAAKEIQ